MRQITIPLDEQSAERLQALAHQRGQTVEETAQAWLRATLPLVAPASPPTTTTLAPEDPDDPDGSKAILALSGTVHYPSVTGKVTTTNEEIDQRIAEEAMNSHADE